MRDFSSSIMSEEAKGTGEYIFMNRGKHAKEDNSSSGEDRFEIGPRRFVEVTKFKGSKYVNVREYYRDGDRWMPSKKGIALRPDEFHMLMESNARVKLEGLARGTTSACEGSGGKDEYFFAV